MGKKKEPSEWTTDEALRRLFPKPVADELKRVARGDDEPKKKPAKPSEPSSLPWVVPPQPEG